MSESDKPYSIHPNGRGRIGRFVTISPSVYVDEQSEISGHCELYGNVRVVKSILDGWCRISNELSDYYTAIVESRLDGFVNVIERSMVDQSELSGDILIGGTSALENCQLSAVQGQQIRVIDSMLSDVSCYGPVFVQGAEVSGCEILPLTRITGGTWAKAPRIVRTSTQFSLCEAKDDQILIGCLTKTVAQWKELAALWVRWQSVRAQHRTPVAQFAPLADFEGFTADEINAIAAAIEAW